MKNVALRLGSIALVVALAACGGSEPSPSAPAAAPAPESNFVAATPASASSAPAPTGAGAQANPSAGSAPAAPSSPDDDRVKVIEHGTGPNVGLIGAAVEDADKVIASLQPKFQACYNDGLKKDPKLAGGLVLKTEIKPDGTVGNATATNTEGLNPAVIKCIEGTMKKAKFAPPKAAQLATIDVPLRFASK